MNENNNTQKKILTVLDTDPSDDQWPLFFNQLN